MLKDVLLITHSYYANGVYRKDHSCEAASTIDEANQIIDKILGQYSDSTIRSHVNTSNVDYISDVMLNEIETGQIATFEYYSIYDDMGYICIGYSHTFYQSIKREYTKKMNLELAVYKSVVNRYKNSKES